MSFARRTLLVSFSAIVLPTMLPSCECGDSNTKDSSEPSGSTTAEAYDRGQWLAMAALSDGTPVLASYTRDKTALEFVVADPSTDPTTWAYEPVDGFPDESGLNPGSRGQYASMVVSADDRIWISYYDESHGQLLYATRSHPSETSWQLGVADEGDDGSGDVGLWSSIALDPADNPVIAHYDKANGQLRICHWDGSSFSCQVVDSGETFTPDTGAPSQPDVGSFARLYIASDGTEYIAYYDAAWTRLRLAVGGQAGYDLFTVDDDGDVGQWPSILSDDTGTLHIAYQDTGNQDLRYATGSPGNFTVSVVDGSEYSGADTEVFQDGNFIGIIFFSGIENDIMLASNSTGTWASTKVAGDDAALGFHNEVLTTNGKRYVACYDYTNRSIWFSTLE